MTDPYARHNHDWEPLADSDPTPGEPDGVAGAGRFCADTYTLLTSIADRLGSVCTDDFWKSDAGLEFSTLVTSVATRARAASYRFQEAAGAFGTNVDTGYAGALSSAQSTADSAYNKARSAQDEIDAYRRTHPFDGPPGIGLQPALPGRLPPSEMFNPQLAAAEQEISDAKASLAGAVADRDQQASAAARRLTRIIGADGISNTGTPLAPGETIQSRLKAEDDAAALAQALQNPNDPTSRATIDRIGKDLRAHQNDPGFLSDFFATAPDLAGLARALSTTKDGTTDPLDQQAQTILAEYGTAVAAAAKSGQLPPSEYDRLAAAADPWSAAMLLKYGPNGSAYGSTDGAHLLALMTQNIEHQIQVPGYIPHPAFPDGEDPLTPVLQRAAENGEAARIALGDGSPLAKELSGYLIATQTKHDYSYQGDGPDVEWVRNDNSTTDGNPEAMFLVAAGIPPIRDGSDPYAMAAALNVMSTAADIHERHPDWVPLGPVKNAMAVYTSAYADDLAISVNIPSRGLLNSPPVAVVTGPDVTSLLQFAYGTNDDAWRQFRTGIANEIVDSVAAQGGDKALAPLASFEQLSLLYGVTNNVENGWTMDIATSLDSEANNRLILANAALGAYGNLSLDGPTHGVMQPVSGATSPVLAQLAPDWFATNHAQDAAAAIRQANMGQDVSLEILTAKALLKSGTLSPDQAAELSSVMPTSTTDTGNFTGWWNNNENDRRWSLNGMTPAQTYSLIQQQFDRRS